MANGCWDVDVLWDGGWKCGCGIGEGVYVVVSSHWGRVLCWKYICYGNVPKDVILTGNLRMVVELMGEMM